MTQICYLDFQISTEISKVFTHIWSEPQKITQMNLTFIGMFWREWRDTLLRATPLIHFMVLFPG